MVYATSRTGDGSYSINFYDSSSTYFIVATDGDSGKKVGTVVVNGETQSALDLSFSTTIPFNAGYYGV